MFGCCDVFYKNAFHWNVKCVHIMRDTCDSMIKIFK